MITKLLTRDISLILAASFFYMACPMMVTPLIAGFSESLGASAVLMGLVGGMMNVVSLCCRPFVGNLADKISKYRLSTIGSLLMIVACVGYIFAPTPAALSVRASSTASAFPSAASAWRRGSPAFCRRSASAPAWAFTAP